jgi:fumarate reductase flavoprotein subunit
MTILHDAQNFDTHLPLVIIGAGAGGMTAALAAAECNVEAVILEQDRAPGGSTGMSYGGVCAAGTREQLQRGIADTAQCFEADILAMTKGQTSVELAHVVAREAGPALDWLRAAHDVRLDLVPNWTGLGHSAARMHFPPHRTGEELVAMLARAVDEAQVPILFNARVTALFSDRDNRVAGVRIERPGGTEEIGCDRLILATCGFGANPSMVAEHIPEMANARYFGHEGNRGDAILWGRALGAEVADMGSYQALGSLSEPECAVVPPTLMMGGGFQVSSDGVRFQNELVDVSGQALRVLAQRGGVCWMIYDARLHEEARNGFAEYRQGEALNPYRSAATIADLAALTGIAAAGLEATIAEVDALKRNRGTDRFGRSFDGSTPLEAPYYAVRVTGALFHTQGGLLTDANGRVLNTCGDPLPNLYAVGGAARSVSGPGGWGYLPGMGICTAITLGRLAGYDAAKSIKLKGASK